MRIATIKERDIANGPGIRVSIFVSGCRHLCNGCFNRDIWDFKKGDTFSEETMNKILEFSGKEYIKGLTLLGGEPLDPINLDGILYILKRFKEKYPEKDIWCFTGFVYEYIIEVMYPKFESLREILSLCDVLIDGRFEIDLLDLKLKFRGSKNQRVIDLRSTEKTGEIIWALPSDEGVDKYVEVKEKILNSTDKAIRKY